VRAPGRISTAEHRFGASSSVRLTCGPGAPPRSWYAGSLRPPATALLLPHAADDRDAQIARALDARLGGVAAASDDPEQPE
jgi:hypothetical protein